MSQLEITEILELIPHRYPFLLIDKVNEFEPYSHLKAIKNVSMNEPFFTGHFPGEPIMPGVLILEALAQAGGVLCSKSMDAGEGMKFMYYFGGIDNARFKHMVRPGDVLNLNVSVIKHRKDIWKMQGEAYVGDDLACSAELISAAKRVPA